MAAHIGYLQGNRGDVSRLGSKHSGMRATANGWRIGGQVYSGTTGQESWRSEKEPEHEYVVFSLTHGSGYGDVPDFGLRINEGDTSKQVAKKLRELARRLEGKS